jgi:hypothetical protein
MDGKKCDKDNDGQAGQCNPNNPEHKEHDKVCHLVFAVIFSILSNFTTQRRAIALSVQLFRINI